MTKYDKNRQDEEFIKNKLKQQSNYKTVEAKNAIKTVKIGFRRRSKE